MFPDPTSLPQTLISLAFLTTLQGLVIMTYLLTYFMKYPVKALYKKAFKKNPPKIFVPFVAAFIAFCINMWVLLVLNTISIEAIGLAIMNAFVAAFLAFVSHDFIKDKNKNNTEPTIVNLEPIVTNIQSYDPEDFATKVAAAIRAGDRGEEPPGGTI